MRKLSIGIVGCGVGGCAAALLLRRQGHGVTLFEQSPRVGPVGAGVLLQVSGQRVLQSLGLLDRVIVGAERIEALVAHTHKGKLLSQLRFADGPDGHIAYGLHRGDLFGVLHDAVVAEGIDLRLNEAIDRVEADGCSLRNRGGRCLGRYDLIIAADGSRSRLREGRGVRAMTYAYDAAALWGIGKDDTVHGRVIQQTRGTQRLCGLLPMGGGRTSFFWGLRVGDWLRLRQGSFAKWQVEVIALMPAAQRMVEGFRSFDDLVFATYRAIWMPRPACGRTVFIGDAAHASSPLLGHGINLAMVDARDLAAALANEATVQEAINRYCTVQRWRNTYYSGLSFALTPTFQGRSTLIGMVRDMTLPRLQRVPMLRKVMLQTLAGVAGRS